MTPRVVLLVTSPRLPAGLLSAAAWQALREHPVVAAAQSDQVRAVCAAGVEVSVLAPAPWDQLAEAVLTTACARGAVLWLAGPGGDQELARELGRRLVQEPGLAELELLPGSWDPPGARLLDVVEVMDQLAAPGGDPWKREQTHQTLARYLLEEAYEAHDAIVADDLSALREELGDVLLQVALHARMAQEAAEPWSIDDLAGDLVEKMIRRNPHVFGDAVVGSLDEITANWEQIKRAEKGRESAMDGIALAQPALALADKILSRAERAGLSTQRPVPAVPGAELTDAELTEEALGARLLSTVGLARRLGLDAEAALRRAALRYAETIRATERIG